MRSSGISLSEGKFMDDVKLNKVAIIEKCIVRIKEEYSNDKKNLYENYTKQDSIILNIQRACEASIDLAMHEVRLRHLGIPQESREAFSMLNDAGLITKDIAERMKRMIGFRNIAVHDYKELNLEVVKQIVEKHLSDFLPYGKDLSPKSALNVILVFLARLARKIRSLNVVILFSKALSLIFF